MADSTFRVARIVTCEDSSAGRTLNSRLKKVSRLTSLIYLPLHEFHVTVLREVWIFGGTTEIQKEIIARSLGL